MSHIHGVKDLILKSTIRYFKRETMRTPKEYSDNLKKTIITDEMVSDVLYSYSKRAKNYRDKIREYREKKRNCHYFYDRYDNIEKFNEKKNILYNKKDEILKKYIIQPSCIHRTKSNSRIRIYDYDKKYHDIKRNKKHLIIWSNSYFDYEYYREVNFIDIPDEENGFLYFLYYEYPKHSFHNPINKEDLEKYNKLEIIDIEDFETFGNDINDLLSLQFCDKVYDVIKDKY